MSSTVESPAQIGVFGILGWAMRLMRENLGLIFVVILAIMVPSNILFSLLPTGSETASLRESLNYMRLWNILLNMTFGLIATIMLFRLGDAAMQKKNVTFGTLFSESIQQYFPALGTSLLVGAALVLAFICLIIPGIYFGVLWTFVLVAAVLSNHWGWSAVKKSASLIQGRWWKTFGYLVAFGLIIGFLTLLAGIPLMVLTWLETRGDLVLINSYADLTTGGAYLTLFLEQLLTVPLELGTVLSAMVTVVMYRIWEGSVTK